MNYEEFNIRLEGLKDAYRNNPDAHGNKLAIKLLIEAQDKIEKEIGDTEELLAEAEERSYDQGFKEGRESLTTEISDELDAMEELIEKMRKIIK
jgi:hypothetical protein